MTSSMTDILALVKAGRLQDATRDIQRNLSGEAGEARRPMRDVTPRAKALPGGDAKVARPKARTRKTGTVAGMTRHEGPVPYRLFTPAEPVADAPLVVMLHGCTQTPEDFAAGTGMNGAADGIGAYVIWPEQTRARNANGCWNWFEPAHQGRTGEAAAIAAVTETVRAAYVPGTSGVHVAGLSAGGAMAAILGAEYPDLVASVGIHSGLPAGSARDVGGAFAAMRQGGAATAELKVPAIVFHGDADRTVALANGAAIFGAAPGGATPQRREVVAGGREVIVTERDGSEFWQVAGLGHAWSGGHRAGSYTDPAGPDATAEMLRFFRAVG